MGLGAGGSGNHGKVLSSLEALWTDRPAVAACPWSSLLGALGGVVLGLAVGGRAGKGKGK